MVFSRFVIVAVVAVVAECFRIPILQLQQHTKLCSHCCRSYVVCLFAALQWRCQSPKPKPKRFARHIGLHVTIDFILKKDIILINDGNCCFCVVLVRSQPTIHNAVNAHPKLQTTTLNSSRQQKLVERSFI